MARVIWSIDAANDYEAIGEYIAKQSPSAAYRVCERIMLATRRLAKHPRAGHSVLEPVQIPLRQLVVGKYRILYRLGSDDVCQIIAIVHASRDLRKFLDERLGLP